VRATPEGPRPSPTVLLGMAATPSGDGWWLVAGGWWPVAGDGGIFAFGGAPYLRSTGGQPFAAAAVAIG